jgi:hypothetical protein
MKIALKIAMLSLVLFASCKKSNDELYTLKFYGDAYEDIGYSVSILADGYVIAGQVANINRAGNVIVSSTKDMGIIKTGWDGNVVWKINAGKKWDDWGSKIYQNTDGSIICVGTSTDSTSAGLSKNVFVVKVSSDGTINWQKSYGGTGNQTGIDVVKTSFGYLVLGSTDVERAAGPSSLGNIGGNSDIFLLKLSENGDSVESSPYGYPGNDIGGTIIPDNDGSYLVFGTTEQSDPGQAKNNLLLVRLNSLGSPTNSIIIGGMEDEYAADMDVLSDGYLLVYNILKDDGSQRVNVRKMKKDIYASPSFTTRLPIYNSGTADSSAAVYALSKYKSDSFVLAGQSGKGSSAKMLIFEMDASGNLVNNHQIIKGSTGLQVAYDVTSGDDEYIIAVGKNSYDVNSMITFLKFKF